MKSTLPFYNEGLVVVTSLVVMLVTGNCCRIAKNNYQLRHNKKPVPHQREPAFTFNLMAMNEIRQLHVTNFLALLQKQLWHRVLSLIE